MADVQHGTWSGYKTYGCRCSSCCAAALGGNAKRHEEFKRWLTAQKDRPCVDCDGRFPTVCMQFSHRDPSSKSFAVSQGGQRRRAAVEAEIAKCDLVCANCHAVRTHLQFESGTVVRGRPRSVL